MITGLHSISSNVTMIANDNTEHLQRQTVMPSYMSGVVYIVHFYFWKSERQRLLINYYLRSLKVCECCSDCAGG